MCGSMQIKVRFLNPKTMPCDSTSATLTFTPALSLADEYGIRLWIAALLDPEPITHGASDPEVDIKSPPTYRSKDMMNGIGRTPEKKVDGRRSTRGGRGVRSESPTKETPARKMATPRKPRKGRGKSVEPESVNGDAEDTVKVEVETETKPTLAGDETVEQTKVSIEMPAGHPNLELPEDAEGMLDKARTMVKEAEKIGGPSTTKGKRKAEEMVDEDDEVGLEGPAAQKKAKKVELELKKEKIKRRALMGIAASLAVGYVLTSASPLEHIAS